MKKLFRDAIGSALSRLGFPFLTPHPTKVGKEIGYFQKLISDKDLYSMYRRNQVAHNIIFNVALDALTSKFRCLTPEGEEMKEFNIQVQKTYREYIQKPLLKTYRVARLYGFGILLAGYGDVHDLESPVEEGAKIDYLFSIPRSWISSIEPVRGSNGLAIAPMTLSHYQISQESAQTSRIHESRVIHLQPGTIEDDFEGESALFCVYDLLTVLKSMDWSIGQAMYRHGGGLTTIISGEGARDPQGQVDAIEEISRDLNTKTVLVLPPKTNVVAQHPGALDPASYYQAVMSQISVGTDIPVSILTGAQSGQGVSENDRRDYGEFISALQENDLVPVLRDIIGKFQASGQLPDVEYEIKWDARTIFMIEAARARLYDRRSETEEEVKREVRAKAELYASRAKYWSELTVEKKAEFEVKEEEEGEQFKERAEEVERRGETAKEEE